MDSREVGIQEGHAQGQKLRGRKAVHRGENWETGRSCEGADAQFYLPIEDEPSEGG